ncbi:NUDIX hydrolase [uncultured Amaricoccus sp.]|uniref:NUDIX hydrolase n=1 Tax=uncultured Amaricoccus sp. TaxID=339341 RepID=UPI00261A047D|nr:NUDIX hydrolase [uncultured Amaricoccus sp.]
MGDNGTGAVPIRDAATVVVVRRDGDQIRVLMGQRGAGAVFMPDKFVFPGGAVDPGDLALATSLDPDNEPTLARALPLAAIRELWEETGLMLGAPDVSAVPDAAEVPEGWRGFFAAGLGPRPADLRLFFRAVTPPGRPRRFDARFYLAEAGDLFNPVDDFGGASGELLYLSWLDLAAARKLALPFITEVVLSELEAIFEAPHDAARPIPFFDHDADGSHFRLLAP